MKYYALVSNCVESIILLTCCRWTRAIYELLDAYKQLHNDLQQLILWPKQMMNNKSSIKMIHLETRLNFQLQSLTHVITNAIQWVLHWRWICCIRCHIQIPFASWELNNIRQFAPTCLRKAFQIFKSKFQSFKNVQNFEWIMSINSK